MSLVSVKTALRIGPTTTAFDDEIEDLIAAAKLDLALAGVQASKLVNPDAMLRRAITTYCKAQFGWNNEDAEALTKAYELLRGHLSLSGDYRGYTVTFTVTSAGSPVVGASVVFDSREVLTSSTGVAVFPGVMPETQKEYTVTADDYDTETESVDVTADLAVAVALV